MVSPQPLLAVSLLGLVSVVKASNRQSLSPNSWFRLLTVSSSFHTFDSLFSSVLFQMRAAVRHSRRFWRRSEVVRTLKLRVSCHASQHSSGIPKLDANLENQSNSGLLVQTGIKRASCGVNQSKEIRSVNL